MATPSTLRITCALLLVALPVAADNEPPAIAFDAQDPLLSGADQITGEEAPGYVHFTFDDGPKEGTTELVLDALDKYDIPATFFVTTRRVVGTHGAARLPFLLRAAAHHDIGSHTMSHPNLRASSKDSQLREIDGSLRTLTRVLGRPIGLFRPPYGALGSIGAAHLRKRHLTDVRWEPDSVDYRTPSPEKLRMRTVQKILDHDGGVVLMHDTKRSTSLAIGGILDDLEAANCARLAAGTAPILPVSIHYFLRDHGVPRAIPPEVAARTDAYRAGLPARCAARAAGTAMGD